MKTLKIKSKKSLGVKQIYSIQNNELDLYKDAPNYIVNGLVSKNSKHACVSRDMRVLTNSGYKKISVLKKSDKISYVDSDGKLKLTKKYKLNKTGEKKIYELTTSSGKKILVTEDHKFFKKFESDKGIEYKDIPLKDLEEKDQIITL